ncbi:MAG TPA: hypothetical protein VHO95_12715, partial [Candidatus Dormibacteraeota bacterium]|nr:hypothetical protein [Candidatus Dormibacteraeota bacterium]
SSRWLFMGALLLACAIPLGIFADALPSGERVHGNTVVEPAYDDMTGGLVYLSTPGHLAPLGPTNEIQHVNPHAVAPLYLVVYPPGTSGTFNCMGVPGNCPDHDGAIAGLAASVLPGVYTDPNAIPGHDHLVGVARTGGDFNAAWHVYVELFTSTGAVRHITLLSDLNAAKASGDVKEVDTGIVFLCSIVSESAYMAGTPLG